MSHTKSKISIRVNDNVYLKDPESSELGHKILTGSINLIFDLGTEAFTFRKLAQAIASTEASVYRYFESKHKLLLYLNSWYWAWMEYRLVFGLANIDAIDKKLEYAIEILCRPVQEAISFTYVDLEKLHSIVIAEGTKAYLTKAVDEESKYGLFSEHEAFVERLNDLILTLNKDYKYPRMLVSTLIEGIHHQYFYADHLPALTDVRNGEDIIMKFYKEMIFKMIANK